MHLKHLWYLQLVLAEGSFAAAARSANVSQPAISLAMKALEQELGAPLFVKTGRQKHPTQAAIAAATRAAELDFHITKLAQPVAVQKEWLRGVATARLQIGLAPAAALLYGPVIEKTWSEYEPDGLLSIVSGSAVETLLDVQRGDLDFAIVPRPRRYDASGLDCQPMHVSTPTVYARNGHPLSMATSLVDISRAGWAVAGRTGTAGNVIEEAHRVRKLPPPRVLLRCADYMTLVNSVANSDLLCVIPHPALLRSQAASAMVPLQIREGLPQYEVCLFNRRADPLPANSAMAAVINALVGLTGRRGDPSA